MSKVKDWVEIYAGKDLSELTSKELEELVEIAEDRYTNRKDMLLLADNIPFKQRRETMVWTSVLDERNKRLPEPITNFIKDITTNHLKAILRWTDYDYSSNDSLVLHTINEEYDMRRRMK